jgi:hypothetical protein
MIREKGILIDGIYLDEQEFKIIDEGRLKSVDAPLLRRIKAENEKLTWPWPEWVSDKDEDLLANGQLWRKFYWRDKPADLITLAIREVYAISQIAGRNLKNALASWN